MATSQQVSQGVTFDFRHSLLDLLWKIGLAVASLVAVFTISSQIADWRWLMMPLLWGFASVLVRQLLRRDWYAAAAWSFVIVNGIAVFTSLSLVLASVPDMENATVRVLVQGLPFANLILISLAGMLLPAWSTLLLLAIQLISTMVLPFLSGGAVESLHLLAALFSMIGAGLSWMTSGPLLQTANWALSSYREAESRAEELRLSRDELRKSLQVRDSLNTQLRRANEDLARQTMQLQAAAEISRLVTSTLDLDEMLPQIVQVLSSRFEAYTAVFLAEEGLQSIVLRASSVTFPELQMREGDRLQVNERSAVGACVLGREAEILTDVRLGVTVIDHLLSDTRSEVAVPLISRGEVIGALDIQSPQLAAFGAQDRVALVTIADQIANAISNVRAFAETREALQEVSRLQRRYVQEAWERFMPQLEAAGYRYTEGEVSALSHRPLPEVSQAMAVGRTVVEPGRGVIAPISFRGEVIGALGLRDPDRNRQWTDEDVNLVESVARQMSVVIDNARLVEETQQRLAEITDLNRRYVREAWDEFLPLRKQDQFVFSQPGIPRDVPLPREVNDVLARNESVTIVRDDGEPESALIAPINLREQIVGALGLHETGEARNWTEDDLALVDEVAAQMSWAIENARLFEETERRAYELEETAKQLRETDVFRSQFLANMSHELRTPLNSIIGFSRVILKGIDGPLTDMQKTDLEAIYTQGQHLLTLINEILDMSKIEAGKMELVIENVDLNVLIRGIVSTSKALVKDKLIALKTDVQEDLPVIRADGTRIRQVITNLMSNAAKFTEEGSITLQVWTDEEMVYVSVQDTGEGIPEDKIPLVFEAFRQVDGSSTRRAEGTGLGMPISRQFVEMHGGRIWLESEYGKGSTFTFCVPIEGPTEVVPELVDLEIDEQMMLLLVVEQDEAALSAYQNALDDGEYQLVGLYEGEEAVRWARYLRPGAILLSAEVGDGAGWDVLEALKSMRATRGYPVVVCSALDEGGRAISMGASAFVSKPISTGELTEVLERLRR
jgi:signal transduction histidine kinase/CheY-like chemotaxis protein